MAAVRFTLCLAVAVLLCCTPAAQAARLLVLHPDGKTTHRGVPGVVDRIAARGQLTPSRLEPLWLTMQRNREWWNEGPLLGSGQRVSFEDSELVWQYVPDEGLQIHPLANFGKLNALWRSKSK